MRTRRKLLGAALACGLLLAGAELSLWVAGVPTLLEREDPSRGFSGLVSVFERDGDRYRTRPETGYITFNVQSFLARKPENGLRVFCVGGSSAFGFPWGAHESFTGILGDVLQAAHPERQVEAVNAAGLSYAMYRVRHVADEILGYEPDLVLVYSGHNEFVEPAVFRALQHRAPELARLEFALAHTRVYGSLRALLAREPAPALPEMRFERFVRRELGTYSESDKREVVARYRDGLAHVLRACRERRVPVLVATLPCNLRDWKPTASSLDADLAPEPRARWTQACQTAELALDAHDWESARGALDAALALEPDHAESHYRRGRAHEGLAQWDAADRDYRRACDLDASPIRRTSAINQGIAEVGAREGALVLDLDHEFAARSEHGLIGFGLIEDYVHPTLAAHELIAWQMFEAVERAGLVGPPAAASRTLFDQVLARRGRDETSHAAWWFNQGVVFMHQGLKEQAIDKFRRALELNPDYHAALANLAQLEFETGDPEQAVAHADRLLALDPDAVLGHVVRGWYLGSRGRHGEAAAAFARAVALAPDLVLARVNLGVAQRSIGHLEESAATLRAAIALRPDAADAELQLGHTLMQQALLEQAVAAFRRALALRAGDPAAWNGLAAAGARFQRLGQLPAAISIYEECARAMPRHVPLRINLGLAYKERGDLVLARASLEQALELEPRNAEALSNLGLVLQAEGDLDRAIALFQQALSENPRLVDAQSNLGRALQAKGDLAGAAGHYRAALALAPDHGPAMNNLAIVLQQQGNLEEAVAHYRSAAALAPGSAETHLNLGLALRSLGRTGEAEASLREALRLKPELERQLRQQGIVLPGG